MRIDCPACAAVYDVPESLLRGRARTMRCAACAQTWTADALTVSVPQPQVAQARTGDQEFAALASLMASADRYDSIAAPRRSAVRDLRQEEDGELSVIVAVADEIRIDARDVAARYEAEPAEDEDQTDPETPEPAVITAMAPTATRAPARPSFALILAWVATLGSVGGVVATFALYPQAVVEYWPAATRLYQAVGMMTLSG